MKSHFLLKDIKFNPFGALIKIHSAVRFQEFYQCDADVVGSKSLLQEIEFIQLYDSVFSDLKLDGVSVKINNRKILLGIAELIGADNKITDFT